MKIHMIIEMDCKQVSATDNMAALVELMKIGSEKSMETISEFMKANQLMMTHLLENPAPNAKPKERAMRLPRVELPMFKGDITEKINKGSLI